MTAAIVRADARHLPLPDASVDLIVTSPPYYALRDYRDGDGSLTGQIGAEASPREYVAALLECTREWMRVLKPTGSLFVNLGDSYAGQPAGKQGANGQRADRASANEPNRAVRRGERERRARAELFTREDAAWLAGVIDSDGSIGIHINKQPEGRSPSFVPWVRVGQMRSEVVTRIAEVVGTGKVMQDGRGVWNWSASAQQARWVLERIHPWLLIKKRQAFAAIEVARHIEERNSRGSWRPLTADDVMYRQRLRDAVMAWNRGESEDLSVPEPAIVPLPLYPLAPRAKSLHDLPHAYAAACIGYLGLILRAEIIWSKANGMPESVTDRVRRSHEQFFHFTKEPHYYSAVDQIREEHQNRPGVAGGRSVRAPGEASEYGVPRVPALASNPLGKLPGSLWEVAEGDSLVRIVLRAVEAGELTIDEAERILAGPEDTASASAPPSVWTVATQPLRVPGHIAHARCCGGLKREGCEDGLDHYAAYPMELPRRIILGWSPPGICTACGEGRRPVVHRDRQNTRPLLASPAHLAAHEGDDRRSFSRGETTASITGYACACPTPDAPTRPSVVVDPFGGTGTSAVVSSVHGRHGISFDLSADYCRLAAWRTTDPGERARALGVPKPPPVITGQGDLFGEPA